MKYFLPLLICSLFALTSCDNTRMFEENKEVPEGDWDITEQIAFDFEVPDTTTFYNFYFNVRNTDDYPFSNLYVFSHIEFPNGKTGTDTIELPLTNPDGSWIGNGQGDIHDCQLIFRKNVRFPVAGKYHMEIEQAMRMEKLPGVKNVGIRIERSEE
jgi:gliding motility-associated lipoprotein GldH